MTPMDCSTPGLPVLHYLPEFAQTHFHRANNDMQPSHPVVPFSTCLNLCHDAYFITNSKSAETIDLDQRPYFTEEDI